MKTFRLIGVILLTVIVYANFSACSSDSIVPEVTVEMGNEDYFAKNMDFDSSAGEKTFSFNSNVEWSVSVAPTMNGETWCTATPNSGKNGNNTIRVKVQENTGYDDRNVVLTLTAGSTLTKTITVTQKQKDALLLTTNKFEVEPQGGKIDIEIKTNVDYEAIIAESCKSWISLASKSRGLTTSIISFDIAETEEYDKREGEIIIKSGDLSETVHVYQTGQEILLLTKNEYPVSDKGDTIAVEIKSNFTFDVQMPNVDWVVDESKSRGVSSHTLYYTILPNETYDSREAEIIFYDKNSSIKDTLKIMQNQKDAIIIAERVHVIKAAGETIEVKLSSNVNFEVIMPKVDWIELVESRALKQYTFSFNIAENRSNKERSEFIIIEDKDKQLYDTITIKQNYIPYLTFTAEKTQSLSMSKAVETLEYSVGNSNWKELGTDKIDFGGELGCLSIRGKNIKGTADSDTDFSRISFHNFTPVACSGDIRTLLDFTNYLVVNTDNARFCSLFRGNYQLTYAPELPATDLASYCYDSMFRDCENLIKAPKLSATDLASFCYYSMFFGCTNLTQVPELPAVVLYSDCYSLMFNGCSSLTQAPELPATTLASNCYAYMFSDCISLTQAPELSAETLEDRCYDSMFKGCSGLTQAPKLPARALTQFCYASMFEGCSSLTLAPELPATDLASYCYDSMFKNCNGLIKAPKLPAADLVSYCYARMFFNCSQLSSITMLATKIVGDDCLKDWVEGVASTGTFIKSKAMEFLPNGYSGIPNGWTIVNDDED